MSNDAPHHYADAALDGDRSPQTLAHLASCPACARMVASVDHAARTLRNELPPPSADLDVRVLDDLRAAGSRRPGRPPHRKLGRIGNRWKLQRIPKGALAAIAASLVIGAILVPSVFRSSTAKAVTVVPLRADCRGAGGDTSPERLVVAGPWSDRQAESFTAVLHEFERRTGIEVIYAYETRPMADKLDARLRLGCPPDVALLPQPGVMRDLARRGEIEPIDEVAGALVAENYAASWRRLGTVRGRLYGAWFKAANKSIVWYSPQTARAAGIVRPPATWAQLLEAGQRLSATGITPFAIAGADGWTLTDLFENIYLRQAGPDKYDQLAAHQIPWTHPTVRSALRRLAELIGDPLLVDPPSQTLDTTSRESVARVFGARPQAAMIIGSDFVYSFLSAALRADAGRASFFPFPALAPGTLDDVVVGGDVAVLFNRTAPAQQLIRFLATPEAAEPWAAAGGFVSPNRHLDPAVYPDTLTRQAAARVAGSGTVRFDLSDLQPPNFGAQPEQGMQPILQDLVRHPHDVDAIAHRLERAAPRR